MHIERLVEMANDIAANLSADPEAAAAAIADHIHRFWEPRMREQLIAHYSAGGDGLEPMAGAALALLVARAAA